MKTRPLGKTGINVPVIGVGAAGFGDVYGQITQDSANETVTGAIEMGANLFDTSPHYGLHRSEKVLGKALEGHARDSYILTSKCGRFGDDWDFSTENIKRSIPESLERLGVEYIDVMQCHDIDEGDTEQAVREALPVLRDYQQQGLIRHIGITGYLLPLLEKVAINEGVETVMTYCTYNLQDRRLLDTANRLGKAGIGVFSASPLHMAALTRKGAPEWHPGQPEMLERTLRVVELCNEYGTTVETVAMQFALDLPDDSAISSTVVGVTSPVRLAKNIETLGQKPDPELLAKIEEIYGDHLNVGWPAPLHKKS